MNRLVVLGIAHEAVRGKRVLVLAGSGSAASAVSALAVQPHVRNVATDTAGRAFVSFYGGGAVEVIPIVPQGGAGYGLGPGVSIHDRKADIVFYDVEAYDDVPSPSLTAGLDALTRAGAEVIHP